MGGESRSVCEGFVCIMYEASNQCMQSSSNIAIQAGVRGEGRVDIVPLFGEYRQVHDLSQPLQRAIQPSQPSTQPACQSFIAVVVVVVVVVVIIMVVVMVITMVVVMIIVAVIIIII